MSLWDNRLIGRWRCDEAPGSVIQDRSGYGHNLTETGTVVKSDGFHGLTDTALNVTGTNKHYRVGSTTALEIATPEIVCSMWFKLDLLNENQVIFSKGYPGGWDNSYTVFVTNANKLRWRVGETNSINKEVDSVTTMVADTWYFIVCDLFSGYLRIYINDVFDNASPWYNWSQVFTINSDLRIGNYWGGLTTWKLNGHVKDCALWDGSISAAERTELHRLDENHLVVGPESIKYYLTGASSDGGSQADPNASLGDYRSSSEVSSTPANSIFDDVANGERVLGENEYRCIAIKNEHSYNSINLARIWKPEEDIHIMNNMSFAVEVPTGGDTNGYAQLVSDENTSPIVNSGNVSDWETGNTQVYAIDVNINAHDANLDAGEIAYVWLKREIVSLCPPRTAPGFKLICGESTMRGYEYLTGLSNCTLLPDKLGLIKNGGSDDSWDTDAYSIQNIPEFALRAGISFHKHVYAETGYNHNYMVGLDPTPSGNDSHLTCQYNWWMAGGGGVAYVYTNGVNRGGWAWGTDTDFSIRLNDENELEFYQQGVLRYTTSSGNGDSPTFPLYLDTGLNGVAGSPAGPGDWCQIWEPFLHLMEEVDGGFKEIESTYDVLYSLPSTNDLKYYLTGASSDGGTQVNPNLSLGNYRSSTEIISAELHNLFGPVGYAGSIDFRCICVRNETVDNIFDSLKFFIQSQPSNVDVTFDFAIESPIGNNQTGYAQTIPNETSSPTAGNSNTIITTGNVSAWNNGADRANGMNIAVNGINHALNYGGIVFIWIKRTVVSTYPGENQQLTLRASVKRELVPVSWDNLTLLQDLPRSSHLYKAGGSNSWTDNYALGTDVIADTSLNSGIYFYRRIFDEDGVGNNSKTFVVGLNEEKYGSINNPYSYYDYCWYISGAGYSEVYVKGVQKYQVGYGSYQHYTITFNSSGQLEFKEDGNIRYTTTGGEQPLVFPLYVESQLYTAGPRYITDVQMLPGGTPTEFTKDLTIAQDIIGVLDFYLTGASSDGGAQADPNASLGNYRSSTQISLDQIGNLFDDVTEDQSRSGYIDYRCICIRNEDGVNSLLDAIAYINSSPSNPDVSIEIAVEVPTAGDTNGYVQDVATEETAPIVNSGNVSDWSIANSRETGILVSLGSHDVNLDSNEIVFIWIKRTVSPGATATSNDSFQIKFDGIRVVPVDWKSLVNVVATPSSNDLTKNAGGDAWNGGAVSIQQKATRFYGAGVQFNVRQNDKKVALGLSADNPDEDLSTIDYVWEFDSALTDPYTGKFWVRENGSIRYSTTDPYTTSYIFSIVINASGYLEFYRDTTVVKTLLYTSSEPITYPLFVDTSIYHNGSGIDNVEILAGTYVEGGMNFNVQQAGGGVLFIPDQLGINYLNRRAL